MIYLKPLLEPAMYKATPIYLKTKLLEFKEAYLIDNSTHVFHMCAKVMNGKIIYKKHDSPQWIYTALSIVERIQDIKR